MAFGRSRRLARTAAHTAVAAATIEAVSGRSARRNAAPAPVPAAAPAAAPAPVPAVEPTGGKSLPSDDVIAKIERLAALHTAGALTDEEFTELKSRALS